MNQAQQAFAEGFAALLEVHGSTWAFGGSVFQASATKIELDDPRMEGSGEQLFSIQVLTSALPATRPGRGDSLVCDGKPHRVVRPIENDFATGITTILVTET